MIKIFKIVVYTQHFGRWWKQDSMPREQDLGVRTGWSPRHLSLLEVLLLNNFYLYRLLARWGKMFQILKIQNKTKHRKCAKQSARKLENELQRETDSKITSSAQLLWYAGESWKVLTLTAGGESVCWGMGSRGERAMGWTGIYKCRINRHGGPIERLKESRQSHEYPSIWVFV